mmetsp:Transcript_1487/g.3157  ORF Transcript_1487/g.3157 Transcript_1487/m.3157 type:complete len:212 (+) Transcript_1487:1214-1849(+)
MLQVAAHRTTHTTIVHDDDFLRQSQLVSLEQLVVDGNLAEFVFDDCDLLLLLLLKDVVQQSRLPRSQEACQNRHWQFLAFGDRRFSDRGRHNVAVATESVTVDEAIPDIVRWVQCLLRVLEVPKHLDLHLHIRPRLLPEALNQSLDLLHKAHDGRVCGDLHWVLADVQGEWHPHGRMEPRLQSKCRHPEWDEWVQLRTSEEFGRPSAPKMG